MVTVPSDEGVNLNDSDLNAYSSGSGPTLYGALASSSNGGRSRVDGSK